MIAINRKILNMNLRHSVIHLFLKMICDSDENGIVIASQTNLMEWTQCKDKKTNISYIKELLDNDLIEYVGLTDRKKTYKLNSEYYSK